MMEIKEIDEEIEWECNECGEMKACYIIAFKKLCEHFLCLCPDCFFTFKIMIALLEKGEKGELNVNKD